MKRLILFIVMICLSLSNLRAENKSVAKCELPSATVTSTVTEYAMKKYHVAPGTVVKVIESIQANDECYWKYHFQTDSPRADIVLYLAPDRRYLTTTLYDRLSDPLVEEKLQREQIAKLLIGAFSPNTGPQSAAVTLVEFSDFQCPYCQKLADILEKEVLPGEPDLRIVFRNYPLPMHPFARLAAEIAACAGMQSNDAFWSMHDYIFSHQKELTADNIKGVLTEVADRHPKIDQKAFHQCVESGLSVGPVMKDEELGRKFGVHATPTVFINGSRIEGIRDAAQLKQLIAAAKEGRLPPATADSLQPAIAARPATVSSCSATTATARVCAGVNP